MAIEKNIVIGADLSGLEAKLQELINLLKQSQKQANKTADSIDDIADSVEDVGDNAKKAKKGIDSMSAGFKTLGLSIKAAGIGLVLEGFRVFKDVLSSNQEVADTFAVSLQTLIFAFNGIIKAVSEGDFASIPRILASSLTEAKKFVELQKIAMIADAERNKLQLESQILAERQRQLRDNERKSIADRIEANEELNRILGEQLIKEEEAAYKKLQVAQLEYDRNPNNENYLQLLEAQTEQIDIQERIEGQMSEYQMNKNSLIREEADLKRMIHEQGQEQFRIEEEGDISIMGNRMKALKKQYDLEVGLGNARLAVLDGEISKLKKGTLEYQEAYGERMALEAELAAFKKQNAAEEAQLRRDNIQENFDLTSQGFDAIMQLNEAYNKSNQLLQQAASTDDVTLKAKLEKESEYYAEKAFERNKKLQTAQAVVNTAQAVTAQLAVPQDALTGQNFVKAGIALATGIAQIRTIQATQFGGGVGSLDSSISEPQSPSFNIVGSTGQNAILESLRNNPVRAYVVGSDVTSQQELDRNRINQVSFP
jgi:hypothetical protein